MSSLSPFDFINAISQSKENLMVGTDNDDLAEKAYNAYLVNKGLSYFPDTIFHANEMNSRHLLDNKPQFLYLLNTIRSRKRYSKWFKNEKVEDINVISECFGYSYAKAKQVQNLLTSDQLKIMRQKLEKGGLKTKEKKNGGEH
jgi:hypothetical protein